MVMFVGYPFDFITIDIVEASLFNGWEIHCRIPSVGQDDWTQVAHEHAKGYPDAKAIKGAALVACSRALEKVMFLDGLPAFPDVDSVEAQQRQRDAVRVR